MSNANGPLIPSEGAAADWQGFPSARPTAGQQAGPGIWLFHTGDYHSSQPDYTSFISRSLRGRNIYRLVPYDWEMRFTDNGSYAYKGYENKEIVQVPFELWCIGINTPENPGDDFRLIPLLFEGTADSINKG